MPCRTCDHLKADGVYCSSPALTNQRYCYFHLNARARRVQAAHAKLHNQPFRLHLPILDNQHSILAGIQQVLDALAAGHIRAREAAVYLYGLQQAAAALKSRPEWKGQRPEIEADQPLRALEIYSLRDQYDLPYDTDLSARPDVAAAEIDATIGLTPEARPSQIQQLSLARVPARPAPPNDASPSAPEPALSMSKGAPIVSANRGEVPDAPATDRKPPASCPTAARDQSSDAA